MTEGIVCAAICTLVREARCSLAVAFALYKVRRYFLVLNSCIVLQPCCAISMCSLFAGSACAAARLCCCLWSLCQKIFAPDLYQQRHNSLHASIRKLPCSSKATLSAILMGHLRSQYLVLYGFVIAIVGAIINISDSRRLASSMISASTQLSKQQVLLLTKQRKHSCEAVMHTAQPLQDVATQQAYAAIHAF